MTQSALILDHLKTGASITPIEALSRYGCFRLGARIYDLRKDGHTITTERYTTPHGAVVARYRLKA